jgi:ERF superfamily
MSIIKIQEELKAPKNQRNNFGNYNYRSAEDIIEAVKPIAHKYGYFLNISDEIVEVGGRVYVKAVAMLIPEDKTKAIVESYGWAREEENKKGMDASQITGACSSYARKYALNGLLAIDDTKDSDATNKHDDSNQPTIKAPATSNGISFPFPLLAKGETKWLNDNTTEYTTIKALVEKGATLTEVRKYFSVSKKIADKLLDSIKAIG